MPSLNRCLTVSESTPPMPSVAPVGELSTFVAPERDRYTHRANSTPVSQQQMPLGLRIIAAGSTVVVVGATLTTLCPGLGVAFWVAPTLYKASWLAAATCLAMVYVDTAREYAGSVVGSGLGLLAASAGTAAVTPAAAIIAALTGAAVGIAGERYRTRIGETIAATYHAAAQAWRHVSSFLHHILIGLGLVALGFIILACRARVPALSTIIHSVPPPMPPCPAVS
jgi:hypothetical protein